MISPVIEESISEETIHSDSSEVLCDSLNDSLNGEWNALKRTHLMMFVSLFIIFII